MHIKKIFALMTGIAFMIIGISATNPQEDRPRPKNLKVLSKNISHEDLDKLMEEFKAALGVKCNFCHAQSKDSASHTLDFSSDDKPEKNIARQMIKMTAKINKKYFSFNKDEKGEKETVVSCMTCHRRNPDPNKR